MVGSVEKAMVLDTPSFVTGSPLLEGAFAFATDAHHGPRRRGETDIGHPEAVARLLHEHGFDERVVAAALLHDVIEDTATELEEVEARFGAEVACLVGEMTEDSRIEPYASRKAEHRARIARDGRAAAIYAADKIANIRSAKAGDEPLGTERLDHYVRTMEALQQAQPHLPFLADLRSELESLRRRRAGEAGNTPGA